MTFVSTRPWAGPRRALRAPMLPLLLLAAACAGERAEEGPAAAVTDSAGIEIVTVQRPSWTPGEEWTVTGSPLLEIGRGEGDPAAQFSRIRGVLRLPDGRIVVAESSAAELRYFDADGRHVGTAGREGEGPGEFTFLSGVEAVGDTVLAYDFMPSRVTRFDGHGAYLDDVSLDPEMGRPRSVHPVEGGYLGVIQGVGSDLTEALSYSRREAFYRRFGADGTGGEVLDRLPGQEYLSKSLRDGNTVMMMTTTPLIGHSASQAVVDGRLVAGTTDGFELRVYGVGGGLERLIRMPERDVPVTEEEWGEVMAEAMEEAEEPAQRTAVLDMAELRPAPELRPAYGRFVADAEGFVWVEPFRPAEGAPTPWLVVDPDGEVLGDVLLPEGFTPMDIGRDYVLGVIRDDFDVPFVQMFSLIR